jgi:hypothetical protein
MDFTNARHRFSITKSYARQHYQGGGLANAAPPRIMAREIAILAALANDSLLAIRARLEYD